MQFLDHWIKNRRPCNETENKDGFASPAYSSGNRADCLPCLQQGSAVRIPLGHKASVWLICTQKKSSSVKITLLLKVDLEGFEPLTSRMRTERSPSNIAFVHTLCTVREEKWTYIRLYEIFCHPNDLSRSQVWSPSRWFSRWCSFGRNMGWRTSELQALEM